MEKIIKDYYSMYEKKDWKLMENLLAEGFTFTSPNDDDHIDVAAFKKKCWPQACKTIKSFDVDKVIGEGDEAFARYRVITTNGASIRNAEYFRFENGKIKEIAVYFGPGHRVADHQVNSDMSDRELRLSRELDAPVELVWEVWTTPEHLARWWGPNGFTNTIDLLELRPGGEWHLVMHGPDGTDYVNRSVFREVVPFKRIVYEHVSGPKFTATIDFEARGSKTLINWHMLFETAEQFIQVVKTFKADEGLKQNIEKLSRYLSDRVVRK
jgi:uncharacterized protein YndB with AHSA1/START domain